VTSPDLVVGAAMVAAGVAAYAVNRLALTMQANTAAVKQDIDDLVKVAAAAGVYVGQPVDHDRCDDCGRTICQCNDGPEPPLCPGAVEQGCRHGRSLCLTCMAACPECLADLRSQGVLSLHSRNAGWWSR